MWLASASFRNNGGILATDNWTEDMRFRALNALRNELLRVGNPNRERLFQMNITLCLHRACSEEEKAKLPPTFFEGPGGLAGGPVEILSTKGLPPREAALPCRAPKRQLIDERRPDLWLPIDCGKCPPCRERAEIRR